MDEEITRRNHYVPIWYQKGFLAPGCATYHYLDMSPEVHVLPDGQTRVATARRQEPPQRAFVQEDLYTTFFGVQPNDAVEKRLFGGIDDRGARAIRALVRGDPRGIHANFLPLFEFCDAQKLRTPKGLDWIRAQYPSLDQLALMVEMQGLRRMHCTMWIEGVREIVSARDSDVKFIVSDHPVTVYNRAFPPDAGTCVYPGDPGIDLVGTQTVFALDADHCLVFTHLENTERGGDIDPTRRRTNARFTGGTLGRTDTFIRTRSLARDEVIAINALLKARARRYMAAADPDWLSPETGFSGDWSAIGEVLRPRDELWRYGGEIYVGHKDGTVHYQDAFGRTSRAHEHLARKNPKKDVRPNESCGCGSGKKYKHCCLKIPEAERPSWHVRGLRERNLIFCRAIADIVGLSSGKTWEDVRRELNDQQVARIHEVFGDLWPADTQLDQLVPRQTDAVFRALYFGVPDVRTIEASVVGWLAHFDEIIIAHPFIHPASVKPDFSPLKAPASHRAQTLKNILLFLLLEPYIDLGFVHVVPNPGDFNAQFGWTTTKMAERRTDGLIVDEASRELFSRLFQDDTRRSLYRMPDASLKEDIRRAAPEASEDLVDSVVRLMRAEVEGDPCALLQPVTLGEDYEQHYYFKGYALEAALYLASLTGAAVYTDVPVNWRQLHEHTSAVAGATDATWNPVVEAVGAIRFPVELNAAQTFLTRRAGRFGAVRAAFRRVDAAARTRDGSPDRTVLGGEIRAASAHLERDWSALSSRLWLESQLDLSVPPNGFERIDVQRLLLTFGTSRTWQPVRVALFARGLDLKGPGYPPPETRPGSPGAHRREGEDGPGDGRSKR